ncbi:MAG TPA: cupin domain-containing protein [Dehalococcoidia bacterium]|nr:cupin domain-containing protein [Dehalococcoidia bacterium]
MTEIRDGIVLGPRGGRHIAFAGNEAFLKVTPDQTESRLSVVEFVLNPGVGGPPLHIDSHDEVFYVLEGGLTFQLGEKVVESERGGVVCAPRGVPHTFENREATAARLLVMFSPGGFEQYYVDVAALGPGRPEPGMVREIASHYDTKYLGPPAWR